ncbi:PREDICTED: uncharacterized protein LOC107340345 isoform X3 [Acropora digitifera]|uniref:uncharacterized protein LOC107340345 isoform X3 n=1 Tax=Acropora digitifera TaxID=70779 RepID=UPI00077A3BC1|nr:PREDICTED: uncharacterized protein LOC107340345 isoform X3 [Acropora digitifera]
MTVPEFPTGDLLTAIDNDQVLIKKWTVRKDNRAQISVLTSVCVAQISPYGTLQLQPSLAPRNWSKRIKVAKENPEERTKVIEDCKWRASFVYKSFVHPEILKEQAGRWRGIYPCHA